MKSRYWWASVIILTIILLWLLYLHQGPHEKSLQPGSDKYEVVHGGKWKDTISQWTADHDTTQTAIMHYWYKDSNNVWYEQNCGDTSCWIHRDGSDCRTDSSEYKKRLASK